MQQAIDADGNACPRLARRIKLEQRAPLATLDDAIDYMLGLSDEIAQHKAWQRAAGLALDARRVPTRERMAALTRQIEHALFMTDRRERRHGADGGAATAPCPRPSADEDAQAAATSSDLESAMMSAHQKNIERYQGLLETYLNEQERRFVEQRVAAEQAALWRIFKKTQPADRDAR